MTPTPDQLAAITVIIGLGFLASIGGNIAMIIRIFRRNPPIDQTLQEYAKRAEMQSLATQADATYARKSEFEAFRDDMQRNCAAKHTQLDGVLKEVFDVQREGMKDVADRLDRNHAALASWQRGIERQLGHLDGRVDKVEGV